MGTALKRRLDRQLVVLGLVRTRSQAESYIRLGEVTVNGRPVTKPSCLVGTSDKLSVTAVEQYVSRAALKLASVARALNLSFTGAEVLDVGSSTGGFTEYALRHGARRVVAVEVGSNQLHPSLRGNPQIELHEKTDIRDVRLSGRQPANDDGNVAVILTNAPDIIVADVSFISLRDILPHLAALSNVNTQIVVMLKPQFEAGSRDVHKGVIKNDTLRRTIIKDFEIWAAQRFSIVSKADSAVAGAKGNKERFYLLTCLTTINSRQDSAKVPICPRRMTS